MREKYLTVAQIMSKFKVETFNALWEIWLSQIRFIIDKASEKNMVDAHLPTKPTAASKSFIKPNSLQQTETGFHLSHPLVNFWPIWPYVYIFRNPWSGEIIQSDKVKN